MSDQVTRKVVVVVMLVTLQRAYLVLGEGLLTGVYAVYIIVGASG